MPNLKKTKRKYGLDGRKIKAKAQPSTSRDPLQLQPEGPYHLPSPLPPLPSPIAEELDRAVAHLQQGEEPLDTLNVADLLPPVAPVESTPITAANGAILVETVAETPRIAHKAPRNQPEPVKHKRKPANPGKQPRQYLGAGKQPRSRINTGKQPKTQVQARGNERKKRRYKPGTLALREIQKYQKSVKHLVPKVSLMRCMRELLEELRPGAGIRFTPAAVDAIQESAEVYLTEWFEEVNHYAIHAHRVTIMPTDIRLGKTIRKLHGVDINWGLW